MMWCTESWLIFSSQATFTDCYPPVKKKNIIRFIWALASGPLAGWGWLEQAASPSYDAPGFKLPVPSYTCWSDTDTRDSKIPLHFGMNIYRFLHPRKEWLRIVLFLCRYEFVCQIYLNFFLRELYIILYIILCNLTFRRIFAHTFFCLRIYSICTRIEHLPLDLLIQNYFKCLSVSTELSRNEGKLSS